MRRGIDHLVLAVHDLQAARDTYARMGFTLTPTAQHPFGTANCLVQLDGNFLELLAIDDRERIVPSCADEFSFAQFNEAFLKEQEGMSMLVFASNDARADQAEFASHGLQTYAPFDFSRKATLPDGEQVTVGFSLAFVTHPAMPNAAFFCCQQHAPQHFWKPQFQRHRNTAKEVASVSLVVPQPNSVRTFFSALQGENSITDYDSGLSIQTHKGQLRVCTQAEHVARCGHPPRVTPPAFAAFEVAVSDLNSAEAELTANEIPFTRHPDCLQVQAEHAHGVVIEFSERT